VSPGPLDGQRIVVTRAAARAGPLSEELAAAGATVIAMAAARVERILSSALDRALEHLNEYAWALFTSRTAVEILFDALAATGGSADRFIGVKVAAIGPTTASALEERGIGVTLTPSRHVAEGLLEALGARSDVHGARVLYATADGARDVLPNGLRELGATVDRIAIYRSVPDGTGADEVRRLLDRDEVDLVTFTSPSTVQGFVAAVGGQSARRAPAATIGPITSQAARAAGIEVAVEARESTASGLVRAVIKFVSTQPGPK
jgi:uroporphyrinogen-III synthase